MMWPSSQRYVWLLVVALGVMVLGVRPAADAATILVVNNDGAGEGFNDPTVVAPVGGNPGTTLGAQRLNAFQHAANIWGGLLSSTVTIRVGATFDPLTCNATSAVLGSAGPTTAHRDFTGAPVANTWYVQALANALNGNDLDAATNDLSAQFNSSIGTTCSFPNTWYYGLDRNAPGTQIDFVSVVLHELGHGLGFVSLVNLSTGAKFNGLNDTYMRNLENHGASPADYPSMTNAQRVAASISTGNLHWVGAKVQAASGGLTAGTVGTHVRMYAPNPAEPGSSVSHWDTALTPNESMEPSYTGVDHTPGLTLRLFEDLGWILSTTAVKVEAFTAQSVAPGRVLLQWRTGLEVDNLGFQLYREQDGQRLRVTPHLLAGSALRVGAGTVLEAGHAYSWWDTGAPASATGRYWLEDVDLSGRSVWHGPITVVPATTPGLATGPALSLASLGSGNPAPPLSAPVARRVPPVALSPQTSLATQPALKLAVREDGWYRLPQSALLAVGVSPLIDPRFLRLYVDGHEIPMRITGQEDGRLDASEALEFYGLGVEAPWTDTRIYWLVGGTTLGQRITSVWGPHSPDPSQQGTVTRLPQRDSASSFPMTVEKRERTVYFSALRNGEQENFFGAVVSPQTVQQILQVYHLTPTPTDNPRLQVVLQGVTQGPHQVAVTLNGASVGTVVWQDQGTGVGSFTLASSWVRAGQNQVELTAQGGPRDISVVDTLRLTYGHLYTANQDALQWSGTEGQQVTVDGFRQAGIRVMDITQPDTVREVGGVVTAQGGAVCHQPHHPRPWYTYPAGVPGTPRESRGGDHPPPAVLQDPVSARGRHGAHQPSPLSQQPGAPQTVAPEPGTAGGDCGCRGHLRYLQCRPEDTVCHPRFSARDEHAGESGAAFCALRWSRQS